MVNFGTNNEVLYQEVKLPCENYRKIQNMILLPFFLNMEYKSEGNI